MTLRLSHSAYQAFLRCETKYWYGSVERLHPRTKAIAPQKGILIHEYMEGYYKRLLFVLAEDAHEAALADMRINNEHKIHAAANACLAVGDDATAAAFLDLIPAVERIMERYYLTRGRQDAEMYDVLLVEERIEQNLTPTIVSTSVIDLVLRERDRGLVWLTEHKSTVTPPQPSVRVRDFQTLLYADVLRRTRDINVDGVLWNYIRTKEPAIPRLLKSGELSKDKTKLDSDWTTYFDAIGENNLNPGDYEDMRLHLDGRETTVFFPRYEHVIYTSSDIMLRDYVTVATRMEKLTSLWETGAVQPVRALTRDCSFCGYIRLCEAVVTGSDPSGLIEDWYERKEPREEVLEVSEDGAL